MAKFEDFEYRINDDNEVEIIKYVGNDRDLIIPDRINNFPVVSIVDGKEGGVFENKGLNYVKFPNELKYIGNFAFQNNQFNFHNLLLPHNLIYIGDWSFCANGFKNLELPVTVEYIGESAFKDNQLKNLFIPKSIKELGYWAFGDNLLEQVILPANISFIRDDAFGNGLSQYYIRNERMAGKYFRSNINNRQWKNEENENMQKQLKIDLMERNKQLLNLFNNGKNQDLDLCLSVVKINGKLLRYVKEKTYDICLAAVKQNVKAIKYIDQTSIIFNDIIKDYPELIEHLK